MRKIFHLCCVKINPLLKYFAVVKKELSTNKNEQFDTQNASHASEIIVTTSWSDQKPQSGKICTMNLSHASFLRLLTHRQQSVFLFSLSDTYIIHIQILNIRTVHVPVFYLWRSLIRNKFPLKQLICKHNFSRQILKSMLSNACSATLKS